MPDIVKFYLSGGASNADPNLSLGGVMSSVEIDFLDPQDNLFDDVLSDNALNGHTDYRCFYIMNVSDVTVTDLVVVIDSQVSGGSDVVMGDDLLSDQQAMQISGTPDLTSNPSVLFNVPGWGVSFQADYGISGIAADDIATFASNIQALMTEQPDFLGVTVSAIDDTTMILTFSGFPFNHLMPLIDIMNNTLGGGATINVTKQQDGGPVLVTAETIPNEIVTPSVTLGLTSLAIGTLKSGEYLPVWVKRMTPPNSAALLSDNFILSLQGNYP